MYISNDIECIFFNEFINQKNKGVNNINSQ